MDQVLIISGNSSVSPLANANVVVNFFQSSLQCVCKMFLKFDNFRPSVQSKSRCCLSIYNAEFEIFVIFGNKVEILHKGKNHFYEIS